MCTTAARRGDCTKRAGYVCRGTRCVRRNSRARTGTRTSTKK